MKFKRPRSGTPPKTTLASLHSRLVKENPVENSESFSLAHTCPAVQVTTDIKGQYDVLVTPGHYRMATPHDAAGFPAIFSKNDYSDLACHRLGR